jgi:hypothetical protein
VQVFDESIVSKWKVETLETPDLDMTDRMFTYCIRELQWKSKLFKETGMFSVYDGDVVKSDIAVPSSVREALCTAVASLENVPENRRDWHPDSDDIVLDLVHPSLFPVVYGRTRILPNSVVGLGDCIIRSGEGETLSVPPSEETRLPDLRPIAFGLRHIISDPFSRKFQWLPCEVEFDVADKVKYVSQFIYFSEKRGKKNSTETFRITSYINNLHPQEHKSTYGIIEQIIGFAIPLWNRTLAPLKAKPCRSSRISYSECTYGPDPSSWPEEKLPQRLPGEAFRDYWQRKEQWMASIRRVVLPEPEEFVEPVNEPTFDLKEKFAERGLQVIVKLANIHLTPEKPEYKGGTWHIEGQLVCARPLLNYFNHSLLIIRTSTFVPLRFIITITPTSQRVTSPSATLLLRTASRMSAMNKINTIGSNPYLDVTQKVLLSNS